MNPISLIDALVAKSVHTEAVDHVVVPTAIIEHTIRPLKPPLAMPFPIYEFAFIGTFIRQSFDTFSVWFIASPLTIVNDPVWFNQLSTTIRLVGLEISRIYTSIGMKKFPQFWLIVFPRSLVSRTVRPRLPTMPMPITIFPAPIVYSAIRKSMLKLLGRRNGLIGRG